MKIIKTIRDIVVDYLLGRNAYNNLGTSYQTGTFTHSGESINLGNIIANATVFNCVNIIQKGINQLNWSVYEKTPGGLVLDANHRLNKILSFPNPYQYPSEFKSAMIYSILVHGEAFVRIIRNERTGTPIHLALEDPVEIDIHRNPFGYPVYYNSREQSVDKKEISYKDMIHIKDVVDLTARGRSRVISASERIGALIAADRQMANIFKNGIDLKYVISSEGTRSKSAKEIKNLNEQLVKEFGKAGKGNSSIYLENGKITAVKGMTAGDADLRALRKDLITEIACVFGVPASLAGGMSDEKYNNARQKNNSMYRDTFLPIVNLIKEAFSLKLLPYSKCIEFDVADLLKGDTESQAIYTERMVSVGIMTPNEAREYIGLKRHESKEADQLMPSGSGGRMDFYTGGEDGDGGQQNEGSENQE